MLRYALANGKRKTPFKGARAVCPACRRSVIAKCGPIRAHHWAHALGADCDTWSESLGPWHLSWQDLVEPDHVEVVFGPHRADMVAIDGTVVELQHSPIGTSEVRAREKFYGRMVWVFDARGRFPCVASGDRVFFSLGRTEHVNACQRTVFLDYGEYLVQVERFTDVLARFSGFGRLRDRAWFLSRYLSGCVRAGRVPSNGQGKHPSVNRWRGAQPWRVTNHSSRWRLPGHASDIIYPQGTVCIPLNDQWRDADTDLDRPRWSAVVAKHSEIANGWERQEMCAMQALLAGTPMILGGLLRLMPSPAENVDVRQPVATTRRWLQRAERHVQAGRIAVLKNQTHQLLLEQARRNEGRRQ